MIGIVNKLKSKEAISRDESFLLAQRVSERLISPTERDEALQIIIQVLDNWENISRDLSHWMGTCSLF